MQVELNDGVVFRLNIDLTDPESYTDPIFIELGLRYAEARQKTRENIDDPLNTVGSRERQLDEKVPLKSPVRK